MGCSEEELGEVVGRVNEVHALLDEIEGMRLNMEKSLH